MGFLPPRKRGFCVVATVVALLVAAPVSEAAPIFKEPRADGTYLALGDSLAFGYQKSKLVAALPGDPDPAAFNTGYVDKFAALFGVRYPGVARRNLGCPGETSGTFITDTNATTGCTTYTNAAGLTIAIHENHPGKTQLQQALRILNDNPAKTAPVTLDIGSADVLQLVGTCTTAGIVNFTCVQSSADDTYAKIQANLDRILSKLRDAAPRTEIIVLGVYNPLYPKAYQQTYAATGNAAQAAAAGDATDALAVKLNRLQGATAGKYRAYFVDPLDTFNPQGQELQRLCALTEICAQPPNVPDPHPSDAGYEALANLVMEESGY